MHGPCSRYGQPRPVPNVQSPRRRRQVVPEQLRFPSPLTQERHMHARGRRKLMPTVHVLHVDRTTSWFSKGTVHTQDECQSGAVVVRLSRPAAGGACPGKVRVLTFKQARVRYMQCVRTCSWLCSASADVVMRRVYGALLVAMLVVCCVCAESGRV